MLVNTYQETLDKLRRRMYIQSKSYDEISTLLKKKEKMWASRPAIQPINNKELIRIASGFKPNVDSIQFLAKRWMPHKGIDFTAPKGTSVYATGDGRVTKVYRSGSYGNVIFIDHGYGYETTLCAYERIQCKAWAISLNVVMLSGLWEIPADLQVTTCTMKSCTKDLKLIRLISSSET